MLTIVQKAAILGKAGKHNVRKRKRGRKAARAYVTHKNPILFRCWNGKTVLRKPKMPEFILKKTLKDDFFLNNFCEISSKSGFIQKIHFPRPENL
jgi:hypothetical protein